MSGDKEEKTERTGLFKGSHIISVVLLAIDLHLHGRSQRHSRFSADNLKQLGVTRSTQHHVIHTTSGRHVNIGEALLLIHSGEASLESQNHFNRVLWRGKATRVQLHPVEWITRQLRSKTAIPIIERKTRKERELEREKGGSVDVASSKRLGWMGDTNGMVNRGELN